SLGGRRAATRFRQRGAALACQVPLPPDRLEELVGTRPPAGRLVHLGSPGRQQRAFAIQRCGPPRLTAPGRRTSLSNSVLCGSAKYPVRDPFFKDAHPQPGHLHERHDCAADFTIYPCCYSEPHRLSTTSSLFTWTPCFTRCSEQDGLSAGEGGWLAARAGASSPSTCRSRSLPSPSKGVVYNRDEGRVFSDPDQLFAQRRPPEKPAARRALPAQLRRLPGRHPRSFSHEQLLQFHRRHYHPSNATVFTYGSLPLAEHLRFLDSECLAGFGRIDCSATAVPLEPRWSKPRARPRGRGPLNPFLPPDRQVTLAESFLFGDVCQVRDNFHLHFVSSLLCEGNPAENSVIQAAGPPLPGDTSPFYSGLLESSASAAAFGRPASADESVAAARQRVDDILAETVAVRIPPGQRGLRLLHQVELGLRDEGANFGLEKILALAGPAQTTAPTWAELLAAEDLLEETCAGHWPEQPRYLQSLVDRHWRSNPHRLSLSLHPTARYADRLLAAEKTAATARAANADLAAAVRREAQELLAAQTGGGPTRGRCHGWRLATCRDRRPVGAPSGPCRPTACCCARSPPTASSTFGNSPRPSTSSAAALPARLNATARPDEAASSCESGLVFSACCLAPTCPACWQLWQEICAQPDWAARDRLANLLRMEAADLVSRLTTGQGHAFAAGRAAARLSESSPGGRPADRAWTACAPIKLAAARRTPRASTRWLRTSPTCAGLPSGGRTSASALPGNSRRRAPRRLRPSWPALMSPTPAAHAAAARPPQPRFDLGGGATGTASGGLFEHFEVGSMGVNFCAQAFPARPSPSALSARPHAGRSAPVLPRYLHREIREIGGAYGSGARATPGAFYFMSYRRDPRSPGHPGLLRGQRRVAGGPGGQPDGLDLEEAKLAVFKTLDMPVPPKKRGLEFFLTGVTDDMRQQLRDRLFDLDTSEVRQAAAETLGSSRRRTR
uniref:Presequence protease, mitochondrial n=1 Tax=Macrostomum lignano TaxID=282301 RepID=A0A1I8JQ97_9PLAT